MKSTLSSVAVLFAVVLVVDARLYARDGESHSSEEDSFKELFEEFSQSANELRLSWETEHQEVQSAADTIKTILMKTKETLMDIDSNTELLDLQSLLTKEECELMGKLFYITDKLPKDIQGCEKTFSIGDCVKGVDFDGLGDTDFEKAKRRLLTQMIDCDLQAFDEIKEIMKPETSAGVPGLYCQINQLGDVINQVKEAAGATAGAIYLHGGDYQTKDTFATMPGDAITNAANAINKMIVAGVCQHNQEPAPARRGFKHPKNLRAKMQRRRFY